MTAIVVEAPPVCGDRRLPPAPAPPSGRRWGEHHALTPATIFVVDDDPSVRKSLARMVTSAGYVVEAFASAGDFLTHEPFNRPCCVVLDVRMPGLTGLDLQETLARSGHRMPIVFITGHGDIPMSVTAMKRGAVDFLTKPVDRKRLLEAIERALTKDIKDLDEEGRTADVRERVNRLSPRETEVFALVVTGMLNKQIGGELGICEKTVKVHRARVMEKMRAGSVAELVRLADRAGAICPGVLSPAHAPQTTNRSSAGDAEPRTLRSPAIMPPAEAPARSGASDTRDGTSVPPA